MFPDGGSNPPASTTHYYYLVQCCLETAVNSAVFLYLLSYPALCCLTASSLFRGAKCGAHHQSPKIAPQCYLMSKYALRRRGKFAIACMMPTVCYWGYARTAASHGCCVTRRAASAGTRRLGAIRRCRYARRGRRRMMRCCLSSVARSRLFRPRPKILSVRLGRRFWKRRQEKTCQTRLLSHDGVTL